MFNIFKQSASFFIILLMGISLAAINGCDDSGVDGPTTQNNPNVKTYDSIGVEEDSSAGSFNGINLLDGVNCTGGYNLRDASLGGGNLDTTGTNFYLRSGLLDLLDPGYESRWFRVVASYTPAQFDTMSAVYTNIGSAFDTTDFTQEDTYGAGVWDYFNAPITSGDSQPVYCFWLKGKKYANLTNGKNVFGIIQPIQATDSRPGQVYGFKISFRVRINTNGDNDFRKVIPTN